MLSLVPDLTLNIYKPTPSSVPRRLAGKIATPNGAVKGKARVQTLQTRKPLSVADFLIKTVSSDL
jgi:hypothetical protein